ncbi:hypothetical protein MAR_017677 [Mya arenaria]|uniref:Uncharacterized protein n=1 Tax=Mya arenaria TaxID=6604 RepID=A0ABY7EF63_MYAAR|nr:hypothetical protein MAR_017677 [Mya arenaria]
MKRKQNKRSKIFVLRRDGFQKEALWVTRKAVVAEAVQTVVAEEAVEGVVDMAVDTAGTVVPQVKMEGEAVMQRLLSVLVEVVAAVAQEAERVVKAVRDGALPTDKEGKMVTDND